MANKKTGKPALRVVSEENNDPLFADYGPVGEPTQRSHARARQQRARATETFARIPYDRALELYQRRISGSAWVVLVELDHIILSQHSKNPVLFWSPKLKALGLTEHTRQRALRQLEAAGVIKIEPRGEGLAPLVTHLWHPLK
jgi:hypothetical protein